MPWWGWMLFGLGTIWLAELVFLCGAFTIDEIKRRRKK